MREVKLIDAGSVAALLGMPDVEALLPILEKLGVVPIGIDGRGVKLWNKTEIHARGDEIVAAMEAAAEGIDYARVEAILAKAAERQSELAITGLKSYLDTALNEIDERLEKILNCVQAMVRMQGELKDGMEETRRSVASLVTSANSHVTTVKKDVVAEVRSLSKTLDVQFGAIAEGVDSIQAQFKALIREVKGA